MTKQVPGQNQSLIAIKKELAVKEDQYLGAFAERSSNAMRRFAEEKEGHRQAFAVDADRILHSRSYTRYIDKTQVFYMIINDHISHRVLHVQLASKIARTVGRVLGLNEDLIEAIAMGHDIGHPPFGHDGEKMLDELCRQNGLASFQHNVQSVRFLEHIEKKGRGVNLSIQTLDGILCHDGEVHNRSLCPRRQEGIDDFDRKLAAKNADPGVPLIPMTMEGCVMRFSDTVSYIGRDIEDAIELGLIRRDDIPSRCQQVLGRSNGTIVHNLVSDLLANSGQGGVSFSEEVSDALLELKKFNYERIYFNPVIKQDIDSIRKCYRVLFQEYLEDLESGSATTAVSDFVGKMDQRYHRDIVPATMVCDFIAGMTDDYFLNQALHFGCEVPRKRRLPDE